MRTIALVLAAGVVAIAPARAQEPVAQSVIVTTGRAVVQRAPDLAFVTFSVETRAKNPRDAQRQNADGMAAVVKRMGTLGVGRDAMKTLGLQLFEDVDNANGRRVSRGFVARNTLEVRLDDIAK